MPYVPVGRKLWSSWRGFSRAHSLLIPDTFYWHEGDNSQVNYNSSSHSHSKCVTHNSSGSRDLFYWLIAVDCFLKKTKTEASVCHFSRCSAWSPFFCFLTMRPSGLLHQTKATNEVSDPLCVSPGECKYDFQAWGECDLATGKKNRTGVLKRALMDATCAATVTATKPCGKIPKTKLQGKLSGADHHQIKCNSHRVCWCTGSLIDESPYLSTWGRRFSLWIKETKYTGTASFRPLSTTGHVT